MSRPERRAGRPTATATSTSPARPERSAAAGGAESKGPDSESWSFGICASVAGEEAQIPNDTHAFPFQKLDAYRSARALAALVHRGSIRDAELRDQATRAAKSAFLNLCEGLPDDRPAMRRKYFAAADGSLHETVGAVDLAAAIGALGAPQAAEIQAEALRLGAMLRGLLRVSVRAR